MMLRRLLIWTLPVLVAGTASVGLIGAQEMSPSAQMPAAAAPAVAPEPAAISEPTVAPEPAVVEEEAGAQEPQAAPAQETTAVEGEALVVVPAVPPRSLQTLVDERRDMMRQRRNAMLDAFGGRRSYMSPWMASYDDAVERYRDARRAMYRQQRDYNMLRHDSWMDAMCPWSKPQRDWSRQRSILMQLDQIGRQEARDAWLYGQPFAFTGPAPW